MIPTINAIDDIKGELAGKCLPVKIKKDWGWELIFQNTNKYCMKLLHIDSGFHTSQHFHLAKHETMYVISGTLGISFIKDKQSQWTTVSQGEAFVIPPGFVHTLHARDEDVELIEASTYSEDSDSIRIG